MRRYGEVGFDEDVGITVCFKTVVVVLGGCLCMKKEECEEEKISTEEKRMFMTAQCMTEKVSNPS